MMSKQIYINTILGIIDTVPIPCPIIYKSWNGGRLGDCGIMRFSGICRPSSYGSTEVKYTSQ